MEVVVILYVCVMVQPGLVPVETSCGHQNLLVLAFFGSVKYDKRKVYLLQDTS